MDSIGEKFRDIRKSKNVTIKAVSEGITSSSSVQRWENNQGEMSIEKVGKLLNRLHIQSDELINNSEVLDIYTDAVEKAVKENEVDGLKKIAEKLLEYYYRSPQNEQLFFKAAIACNFYMEFTDVCLLENSDLLRLKSYFAKVKVWSQENILLFANTELLLSADDIYINARRIYSNFVEADKNFYYKYLAVNALISAVFCLIEKRDYKAARFIFKLVKTIELSDKFLNETIRINYLSTLFEYLRINDLTKMDEFLNGLKNAGLESKAKEFKLGFSKFMELKK